MHIRKQRWEVRIPYEPNVSTSGVCHLHGRLGRGQVAWSWQRPNPCTPDPRWSSLCRRTWQEAQKREARKHEHDARVDVHVRGVARVPRSSEKSDLNMSLALVPYLLVAEPCLLIVYDLLESAHLMFWATQPTAEVAALVNGNRAVAVMYSCLFVGHVPVNICLAWNWLAAIRQKRDLRSSMYQNLLWNATWSVGLCPWLYSAGVWGGPFAAFVAAAAGSCGLLALLVAITSPRMLMNDKQN